jgi:septal ring factor EnvC (AmiA/AmiB activator)
LTRSILLWMLAIATAAVALVAGCANINVPSGPYVVVDRSRPITAQDRARAAQMDRPTLEDQYLHAASDNASLQAKVNDLKRELKAAENERDRYKDENDNLRDQIKDLRKR